MSDTAIASAHQHAIEEIIHRWFAFFEGTTVSAKKQCELFTEDGQIVHAGQYLLANGQQEIERWLDSVPVEISSHTIDGLTIESLAANQFQAHWQTAYQSLRGAEQVGGALISYQALIDTDTSGAAKFRFIQKTPIANNPNLVFQESFSVHRLKALLCRLAKLIESFDISGFDQLKVVKENKDLLLKLLQTPNTHIAMHHDSLSLTTPTKAYPLEIIEQPGTFPFLKL
ncbi:hypothetical protein MAQ5080_02056 [Marinomonas aquimarina]|uniref:SnoaL-like domain-containing protein n=1 Tax=Marinomonas aquimarina TaxID=295068 RepID=A0A1A8TEN4_9GAMM|nr:hypothetical protein [Marinomonas aquimarina]SBS31754.1 hypothetical protein MAQ5080_02056 [Marinomonas aquimarina]